MKNNIIATERVLDVLEWDNIISELTLRCETPVGRRLIDSLETLPEDGIKNRLRSITELKEMMTQWEAPDFSGIADIEPFMEISGKDGVLQIDDLCKIRDYILSTNRIIIYISKNKEKLANIYKEFGNLNKLPELKELLVSSITDGNELNTAKYPVLKEIRNSLLNVKHEIEGKLNNIFHSPHFSSSIQEKVHSVRNERYVILVKSNMKDKVRGNLHDVSGSGSTLYIEPDEIIGLNNKLIMLERDFKNEMFKILRALSKETAKYSAELLYNLKLLSRLDFLAAAAKLSIAIKGNEPEIIPDSSIRLYSARHPLLYLMSPDTVVSNDISIGNDYKCMIISGANTGGKTVLLKTLGLCVLLAMHGLHIPAGPDSAIGIFTAILADIGDDQSINESLSTYSGQIVILNNMIRSADEKTLILIDEILVGTNPRQGAVLAQAVLEKLARTKAVIMATTHYSELKDLPAINPDFRNASVSFDVESLKPTYRLRMGIPGTSYAMDIAKIYGLEDDIISRAKELLDGREITTEALIENIQKHKAEIEEEYAKINEIKNELVTEKKKYDVKMNALNQKIEETKRLKGIEFLDEIDRYREDIKEKIKSMTGNNLKELEKLQQSLKNIQSVVQSDLKKDRKKGFSTVYSAFDPAKAAAGDHVFISSLEKTGIIDSIDSTGRNVLVLLGNSIKARYGYDDLLTPHQDNKKKDHVKAIHEKKPEIRKNETDNIIPFTMQTQYNTSDLRGLKVDEALEKLNRDFDRMVRSAVNTAVIIHGHGTGALKSAVRDWFRTSYYVTGFRPGTDGEGGDGVSIVLLKE